jgi:hypothetical protein
VQLRNPRRAYRALAAVIAVVGTTLAMPQPGAAATPRVRESREHRTRTPFFAVDRQRISLPEGVMPWGATFAPNGAHIVFQDYHAAQEWIADGDGTHARCLTCGMQDRPDVEPGFAYAFPDNRRMLVANELGDHVYVLACTPTLWDCSSHRWFPVDLSADHVDGKADVGRRTYHLAPDGVHIGYTKTRLDGLLMIVGRLDQQGDKYVVAEPRVVNPRGIESANDVRAEDWARAAAFYELKSFDDGGDKILAFSNAHGIPEQIEVDLASGEVTPLATYPDWNEDGAISPDGSMLLTASWRTMDRLTPLAILPSPAKPSPVVPTFGPVGKYYVSSRPGFACDLQPWLLPAGGDRGGTLVGQPLNPYDGGDTIGANNLSGQQVWSPDSRRVLLQPRSLGVPSTDARRYELQKGPAPNELVVAHLRRAPANPQRVVDTKVGAWAPTPATYRSAYDQPGDHVVDGARSGKVTFTIAPNVAGGTSAARYEHYSDDGTWFIDGTVEQVGSVVTETHTTADLTVTDQSGAVVGAMDADLTFTARQPAPPAGEPQTIKAGGVTTSWQGQTVTGLVDLGPCTDRLPRPSPLTVRATSSSSGKQVIVTAHVTSDIDGDRRPVEGARVTTGSVHGRTNANGDAHLVVRRARRGSTIDLDVDAGDTFLAASAHVRGS